MKQKKITHYRLAGGRFDGRTEIHTVRVPPDAVPLTVQQGEAGAAFLAVLSSPVVPGGAGLRILRIHLFLEGALIPDGLEYLNTFNTKYGPAYHAFVEAIKEEK